MRVALFGIGTPEGAGGRDAGGAQGRNERRAQAGNKARDDALGNGERGKGKRLYLHPIVEVGDGPGYRSHEESAKQVSGRQTEQRAGDAE